MNLIRITSLASVGFAVLVEPAFAGQPVPGPIAGIGLPALVLMGGAYWVVRKFFGGKKQAPLYLPISVLRTQKVRRWPNACQNVPSMARVAAGAFGFLTSRKSLALILTCEPVGN